MLTINCTFGKMLIRSFRMRLCLEFLCSWGWLFLRIFLTTDMGLFCENYTSSAVHSYILIHSLASGFTNSNLLHLFVSASKEYYSASYFSLEACSHNFNYSLLLPLCHLVIARQAQASVEYIHAHVDCLACYIRIGHGAAIAISGDKWIHSEYRLHMQRLPYRSALCIDAADGFKNLCRAALAMLWCEQGFALASDLPAHRILIDDHAAEPMIGLAVCRHWIH